MDVQRQHKIDHTQPIRVTLAALPRLSNFHCLPTQDHRKNHMESIKIISILFNYVDNDNEIQTKSIKTQIESILC